ncbi:A disintegrin and metalloproteinase with thrombospondin motifs like [Prorops nasuta]|uniref:A disintegrin and metalloproteinase with thrombospondin motifs like n=1 Tax=Prorops nasuta TaxID=863751 RepID=UPI0034CE7605
MFKYISLLLLSSPLLILCNVKLTESYVVAERTTVSTAWYSPNYNFGVYYLPVKSPFQNILQNFSNFNNEDLFNLEVDSSVRRNRRSAFPSGGNPGMYRPSMAEDFDSTDSGIHSRSKRQVPDIIYPEVLVTVDYSLYKKFEYNMDSMLLYVVSFFVGVNMRLRVLTDPKIRVNVAAIIIAQDDLAVPYLGHNIMGKDLLNTKPALNDMSKYFILENRIDRSFYDLAVTLTDKRLGSRRNGSYSSNAMVGLAYPGGACGDLRTGLVQDFGGFNGINVAASAIAQLLGANNDEDINGFVDPCETSDVTTPEEPEETTQFEFRQCNIREMKKFLNSGAATCLFSPLKDLGTVVNVPLPGELLSADEQCQSYLGENAISYYGSQEYICFKLKCHPAPYANFYPDQFSAAEGTPCIDDNHFCLDGKCRLCPDNSN